MFAAATLYIYIYIILYKGSPFQVENMQIEWYMIVSAQAEVRFDIAIYL